MEFQDKYLKCMDCGTEFLFTAGEQAFFLEKQFRNEPKRCKACKAKRIGIVRPVRPVQTLKATETKAVCSQCGKQTTVPFKPRYGRPVFCRECFQQRQLIATA
jgi:CxxC-x17-CxxC domain-containing protein